MQENGRKKIITAIQLPQNERTTATYAGRAQTPQVPTLTANRAVTRHGGLWSGQVLGVCNLITKTRDAPQASNGISWRDAADNLICLMIIRSLLKSREKEEMQHDAKQMLKRREREEKRWILSFPPFSRSEQREMIKRRPPRRTALIKERRG